MIFFTTISLLIGVIYLFLIVRFIYGWHITPLFYPQAPTQQTPISIVCPCKNERVHLPYLFQAINEQTYQNFELIIVNDHSTDDSMTYANEVANDIETLSVINNQGKGKKQALKTGIEKAKYELIVTIDADCIPNTLWLETIVDFYEKNKTDLIVCPIKMEGKDNFFTNFQKFEMVSLIASGGGAIGSGMPILCNGANLAFTRKTWTNNQQNLQYQESSGDDIYLLQSVSKRGGKIQFLKSPNSLVITQAQQSIKAFLLQHARWMSKRAALSDKNYLLTAITVYTISNLLIINLLLAPFYPTLWKSLCFLFGSKLMIDTLFFAKIKSFFGLKKIVLKTLLYSLIYPFYVVATSIVSIVPKRTKTAKWQSNHQC